MQRRPQHHSLIAKAQLWRHNDSSDSSCTQSLLSTYAASAPSVFMGMCASCTLQNSTRMHHHENSVTCVLHTSQQRQSDVLWRSCEAESTRSTRSHKIETCAHGRERLLHPFAQPACERTRSISEDNGLAPLLCVLKFIPICCGSAE